MVGYQFGQPINLTVRHLQNTANVAQNRSRLELTECDDLGDLAITIFFLNVANNLAPPRFAEIDVEVRHRDAFRIQETFEQQTQFDRIEIRDGQSPRHNRTGA